MTAHEAHPMPTVAKLTVDHFMLLDAEGAFGDSSRSELIDGTVYIMNAQYSRHAKAKVRMLLRLNEACAALDSTLEVWSEASVRLGKHDMPEPDVFVTVGSGDDGPFEGANVRLAVEIADTTAAFDLSKKADAYARGGVPECWVVNLDEGVVHRLSEPKNGSYAAASKVRFGAPLNSATIPALTVQTEAL